MRDKWQSADASFEKIFKPLILLGICPHDVGLKQGWSLKTSVSIFFIHKIQRKSWTRHSDCDTFDVKLSSEDHP